MNVITALEPVIAAIASEPMTEAQAMYRGNVCAVARAKHPIDGVGRDAFMACVRAAFYRAEAEGRIRVVGYRAGSPVFAV
jgi:hypothetical protein